MNLQDFKQSSMNWNQLLCKFTTLEQQKKIVDQERDEYRLAKTDAEKRLEASDCVWTLTYLNHLAVSAGDQALAESANGLIALYEKLTSPKAMFAVSKSNWTKVVEAPNSLHYSKLYKAKTDDGRPRFTDIRSKWLHGYGWILGTDHQNKLNPIKDKVLKPDTYTKAIVFYES